MAGGLGAVALGVDLSLSMLWREGWEPSPSALICCRRRCGGGAPSFRRRAGVGPGADLWPLHDMTPLQEAQRGRPAAGERPMPQPVRRRWRRGAAAAPLPTRLRGWAGAAALASAALVADRAAQRIDETDLFAGKTMVPSESLRPA